MAKDKKNGKDPEKEPPKALSWREREDSDTAGRRWDSDVRDGFSKWKGQ